MKRIAEIYAAAFADPKTWNEVQKCPTKRNGCGKYFGKDPNQRDLCANCPVGIRGLSEAYPINETVTYINGELKKPLARLELAKIATVAVGAGWGYQSSPQEFASEKYPKYLANNVVDQLRNNGLKPDQRVYEVSEVFVSPALQGKGFGRQITQKLYDYGQNRGLDVLLRTIPESGMFRIAKRIGMRQLDFNDPFNPRRVLFLGRIGG